MSKNLHRFLFTGLLSAFILACGYSVPIIDRAAAPDAGIPNIETVIVGTQTAAAAKTQAVPPTLAPPSTATALPVITLAPPTLLPTAVVLTVTALPSPLPTAALSGIPGASCIPANSVQQATVVDVVDGDTVKVLLAEDGKTYSLRYIGMDTPEMNSAQQSAALQARTRNSALVSGKKVTLVKDVSETDRYNRLLRYVIADNIFVNYQLVADGCARAVSYPPDVACNPTFQNAQLAASSTGAGLCGPTGGVTAPIPLATAPGTGGNAVCSCSGNLYNCSAFATHAEAQACYQYCISQGRGDVHRLDSDSDGQACESLP